MKFLSDPQAGDPSNIPQLFSGLNIKLLCCRYWWLKHWESNKMAFPFWRIYWNKTPGAHIAFQGKGYSLTCKNIYLIPPHTPFISSLEHPLQEPSEFFLVGGRVTDPSMEEEKITHQGVLHLFIHFNLGFPYDAIAPDILVFPVSTELQNQLDFITAFLTHEVEHFTIQGSLMVYALISDLLSRVPSEKWETLTSDPRIMDTLQYIDQNLPAPLSNPFLAQRVNLATNSFTRLFREETQVSPQQYIQRRRVEKAGVLLQHSTESIEEVAETCGFYDRYYFSRIFKRQMGFSPAHYRKNFIPHH